MPTKIQWTDETWQILTGCDILSPGCTNCYAMRLAGTRLKNHRTRKGLTKPSKTGPVWTGEVRFNEHLLDQPLRWRRPRKIFVAAHSDLFYERVPDEWIDKVFAVMALAPQHSFQVLTKRAERMREYVQTPNRHDLIAAAWNWGDTDLHGANNRDAGRWPFKNIWLGVSVEDQTRADERRDHLAELARQGWLTWVSYEPALGPVAWSGWEFIRWLVSGGESAQNKPGRPSHPDWFRETRDWCQAVDVAYNHKQNGDWASEPRVGKAQGCFIGDRFTTEIPWNPGGHPEVCICMARVGAKKSGRLLDGREWNEYPEARP